jgi:hypothetical protein
MNWSWALDSHLAHHYREVLALGKSVVCQKSRKKFFFSEVCAIVPPTIAIVPCCVSSEVIFMKESYCGLCHACQLDNPDFLKAIGRVKSYLEQFPLYWWFNCFPEIESFSLPEFRKGLEWFLNHPKCPGCKEGGGMNQCPIRDCARQRQYSDCNECPDLQTCERFNTLLKIIRVRC